MKNCTKCKYADWRVTAAGKLHPSGDGECTYQWSMPPLPASKCWIGRNPPAPAGGRINRREDFKDHCPYWSAK